ncbi:MAG: OprO/OprP family phosphate-selective porin [Paramuribaculum sp.]|nr:OprO/OprP family phosphate-selective porin [Paramuribaculum sp.]
MSRLLRVVCLLLAAGGFVDTYAANDSIRYVPEFHGTLRGRFELSLPEAVHRFQVRNARVSVNGNFAPWGKYFLQADLSQSGSMRFLDAFASADFARVWSVKAGQFRIPFGVELFQAPHNYMFANRAFIGKQMSNYRGVGAQAGYTLLGKNLTIEGGAFNLGSLTSHVRWNSSLSYAAKVTYRSNEWLLSGGFESIIPYGVRINMIDAALRWHRNRWRLESEYIYEHFTGKSHKPCHGYMVQADYAMPVKWWYFNRLSFQGRFDGMTDGSSGKPDASGKLITDYPERNRITLGATLGYHRTKSMYLLLMVNYEKNIYRKGYIPTVDNADCLLAELVLRF